MAVNSGGNRGGSLLDLSTREIVIAGVIGGVALFLGATRLGFIPVPIPFIGNATIMHIPAIVGGALEGPVVGALAGLIFGIFSFLYADVPIFKDPIIAILPRVLIGVVAWAVFVGLRRWSVDLASVAAGLLGSLTNSAGVLGLGLVLPLGDKLPDARPGRGQHPAGHRRGRTRGGRHGRPGKGRDAHPQRTGDGARDRVRRRAPLLVRGARRDDRARERLVHLQDGRGRRGARAQGSEPEDRARAARRHHRPQRLGQEHARQAAHGRSVSDGGDNPYRRRARGQGAPVGRSAQGLRRLPGPRRPARDEPRGRRRGLRPRESGATAR